MKVGVIDYGVGNLGSVTRALEEAGVPATLVSRPEDLPGSDAMLLPGVGSFADCAKMLGAGGWTGPILDAVGSGKALLGVCVGMQLLADASSEGDASVSGLGLVPGRVRHLRELGCDLRVPHAGWNDVSVPSDDPLFDGIPSGTDFYFVHSYAYAPDDPSSVLARVSYGADVVAAVRRGRVWGTQFHPEKSSRAGARLLRNFVRCAQC